MVSLAMILHDHGSLGKILARSCQDLGKHTHASWQACQDSCHWDVSKHDPKEKYCAIPCDWEPECTKKAKFDESVDAGCTISQCGESLMASSASKTLETQDFGTKNYENRLDCSWTISTVNSGELIEITLEVWS